MKTSVLILQCGCFILHQFLSYTVLHVDNCTVHVYETKSPNVYIPIFSTNNLHYFHSSTYTCNLHQRNNILNSQSHILITRFISTVTIFHILFRYLLCLCVVIICICKPIGIPWRTLTFNLLIHVQIIFVLMMTEWRVETCHLLLLSEIYSFILLCSTVL
jgi:hypothetical protein